MPNFINELALLFILATALSVIARLFKQPLILAYLATGALIAYFGFVDVVGKETFQIFSDLGIMFLLFLVGLEINYSSLRLVGRTSVIVGLGQVFFTATFGFVIAKLLGFALLPALYIATALTFSSTIIIIKLLSDKKDLNSLYGKISIGFLLVQDLVAILILVVLSSMETGADFSYMQIGITLLKGLGLFAVMIWLGRKIMPYLFDEIAHSQELLFLCSAGWVVLVAAGVVQIGFSIEIAGFLAGLALANASETFQIANRIRPLRDFFILIFFVSLGSTFATSDFSGSLAPIIIFSVFVLIGNPLIVLVIMGLMGYKRRTSFLTGLTVAQISEFSLILAAAGLKLGHLDQGAVGIVTAVGIITITISTYFIVHGNSLYRVLHSALRIFERKKTTEQSWPSEVERSIVLIGYHRTGQSLARNLNKKKLMLVDFDPEIVQKAASHGYPLIFGDVSDPEISEKIFSPRTELIISTSPDLEDNLLLLHKAKHKKRRPKIIVRAETEEDAVLFYRHGADYVLIPHFVSGHHLGKTIAADPKLFVLKQLKAKDIKTLSQI